MGSLIASSIIKRKLFAGKDVLVTGHNKEKLLELEKQGATIDESSVSATDKSDIVLLTVKPKDIVTLCIELSENCNDKLVISIAAGVPIEVISAKLRNARIVRAMPNIGATVGEAFTALAGDANENDKSLATAIFDSFGKTAFFDEGKMDALTGISGSGPAFVFLIINAFAKMAEKYGIEKTLARTIAAQIVLGATKTVQESKMSLSELIAFVASKKGTTEAGLKIAEELKLVDSFSQVIDAAIKRAGEISRERIEEIGGV